MKRHTRWSLVGLVLAIAAAGCGGVGSEVGTATQQVTAAPWMAELDLPGCSDLEPGQCPLSWRALGHPHHPDLAIVTAVDLPLCVDTHTGVLEAAKRLNAELTIPTTPTTPGAAAVAPWPGDDPIPLGKEGSEGVRAEGTGAEQQGSAADDPIPLGKNDGSDQGSSSGETDDEPIPLAKVSSPTFSGLVPHGQGNEPIALVDGQRLTPVASAGVTPP